MTSSAGLDRRRLLAASALGVSVLSLPRAVAATSEVGDFAGLQSLSASSTGNGCGSSAGEGFFDLFVAVVGSTTDDIRLLVEGDDWHLPEPNPVSNPPDAVFKFSYSDPAGCSSTTRAAILANTLPVRAGRFENGVLVAISAPIEFIRD